MLKTIRYFLFLSVFIFVISCSSNPSPLYESYDSSAMAGKGFDSSEVSRSISETPEKGGGEAEERMIAYSASVSLSVKNTEETRKIIVAKVNDNKGFITSMSDTSVIARVPAEKLDDFLNQVKQLGKVVTEHKSGVDITDQYRDNVIRLENLKTLRTRYLDLLQKANTVSDLISIEKELERVNTEIDIMEGRIRHAEARVEYSSVTVRFTEKAKPGPIGWIFYGLYRGIKWLFVWD